MSLEKTARNTCWVGMIPYFCKKNTPVSDTLVFQMNSIFFIKLVANFVLNGMTHYSHYPTYTEHYDPKYKKHEKSK